MVESSVRSFLKELVRMYRVLTVGEWWVYALLTNYSRGANHFTEIVLRKELLPFYR